MARKMLSNDEIKMRGKGYGSLFMSKAWEERKAARAAKHLKRNKPKNV